MRFVQYNSAIQSGRFFRDNARYQHEHTSFKTGRLSRIERHARCGNQHAGSFGYERFSFWSMGRRQRGVPFNLHKFSRGKATRPQRDIREMYPNLFLYGYMFDVRAYI